MIKLRPYQAEAKADIYAEWGAGNDNVLAVLPTGAGKTVLFSDIIHGHKGACCAIAHRQELVSQISLALARDGVRHRIIGPTSVVKLCVNQHMSELGASYFDPNSTTAVAGVDTLVRRADELRGWLNSVTLWVMDECFPAGTLIDGKPIESIRVGDYVTAFNEHTNDFEQRRVDRLFKNPAPVEMVRFQAGHHVVECTKGHPIWTDKGWIDAKNITEQHSVYVVQRRNHRDDAIAKVQLAKNRSNILQSHMWFCMARSESKTERKRNVRNKLFHVRHSDHDIRSSIDAVQKNWARILRDELHEMVSVKDIIRNNESNESQTCIGTNDKQQPDAERIVTVKNVENVARHGSPAKNSRRQRTTGNGRRKGTIRNVRTARFQSTNNRSDGCVHGRGRFTEPLQNRLWSRWFENSNRGRRSKSLRIETPGTGCEKGQVFEWQRVDSVQIFKSDDLKRSENSVFDGFVYNIEVEGLHTYVANNVVVHNCHHVTRDNKWGTATQMFPNAKGLGVTATPLRADGQGLGRHADGLFDTMVEGPTMRELINMKYLTEYRIFWPPTDIDFSNVPISKTTGDYNPAKLKTATRASQVIGDVVTHYKKIAMGKLGVTFATDVETATDIAEQYNANGVKAVVLSAKTPAAERIRALRQFKNREILQIVNVDLLGEGFDCPGIEVVSMVRKTESYGLYVQVFGRALRLLEGKEFALIIDHVGNVERHGLPDAPRTWTLDRREKRSKGGATDVIPVRACVECTAVFERIFNTCPFCGHLHVPMVRSGPEFVDGDLTELDPSALAEMRGEIAAVDMDANEYRAHLNSRHVPMIGQMAQMKRHIQRQESQEALRASIAWWGGYHRAADMPDSEIYRRFYFAFGMDMMTAQVLKSQPALDLANQINIKLGEMA